MANLQRMLGAMLMSRMGGRGGRGLGMGGMLGGAMLGGLGGRRGRRGGGGLGRKAGLAAMGYLAYRAYQKNQEQQGGAAPNAAGEQTPQASQNAPSGAASGGLAGITGAIGGIIDSLSGQGSRGGAQTGGSPSFGDRIGAMLDPREPEEETVEDGKALLLIRAMIAAANSDGSISPQERQRIMGQLDQAGADDEDRRIIESELQNPRSLDTLLVDVKDEETAQQFYMASRMAIEGATPTQKSYLDYLRQRLNLPQDDVEEVEEMARAEGGASPPA